jgi:predicted TIM-barrel fold metal-dependent hydrolase
MTAVLPLGDPKLESERYLIVSGDSHVGPSVRHGLRPYCDEKYLDRFDEYTDALEAHLSVEDGIHVPLPQEHLERIRQHALVPGLNDPEARLKDMDDDGVAAEVIYHGAVNGQTIPFSSFGFVAWGTPAFKDLENVGYHIYNRWLADFCSAAPERLLGVAHLSVLDVEAAVQEIEWAAAHGLRSINLPSQRRDFPGYNERHWDPLWAACESNDVTLTTHGGGGDLPPYTGVEGTAIFMTELAFYARRALWHLIFGGVFERYPGLRFVITEQFGDWIPEALRDMNSAYFAPQNRLLREVLPKPPEEYFARNCYVGASFMSRLEARASVDGQYVDRLFWGRDYPHQEGTWPRTLLSLRYTLSSLDPQDIRLLIGENCIRAYNLDRTPLAAIAERIGPTIGAVGEAVDHLPEGMYRGLAFRDLGKWA